jgi:hypothetical protein
MHNAYKDEIVHQGLLMVHMLHRGGSHGVHLGQGRRRAPAVGGAKGPLHLLGYPGIHLAEDPWGPLQSLPAKLRLAPSRW